jgi:type IV fimbrial biogenesis protein FimT
VTPQRPCREQGFTLIEALIVVVMIGVLLTIAAPSFVNFTASQRVKTASFEFYAALSFARSEAIKRRQPVTVAPVGATWASGWTVSVPVAGTPTTLRSQDALSGILMTGATSVVYRLDGRLTSGSAIGVLIQPESTNASVSNRCIRIDFSGVPKSKTLSGTTCP